MSVQVLSVFEGGYQPLTGLTAHTSLRKAGIEPAFCDLYVDGVERVDDIEDGEIIALAVPLFDSLQEALKVIKRLRVSGRKHTIILFGQYATINAQRLVPRHCDYAIVGEWEQPIVRLVQTLLGKADGPLFGVVDAASLRRGLPVPVHRSRDHFLLADRSVAPQLSKYPQPHLDALLGERKVVGGTEATRGCHHKCSYCSVYAVYDGKVLVTPDDLVMQDVRALMDQGMEHLTFIDADFFNSKKHGVEIIHRLHSEFPRLTYDFTTRVDHILENKDAIRALADMNVKVITAALEFPSQRVLDEVFKEIDVPMIEDSIRFIRETDIRLNPTFIMFNPWINLEDIVTFHDFIERNGLVEMVDPIQYQTRLNLYKGSPLLKNKSIQRLELVEHEFHYDWRHPDPRVDELFKVSVPPVTNNGEFKRCCLKC